MPPDTPSRVRLALLGERINAGIHCFFFLLFFWNGIPREDPSGFWINEEKDTFEGGELEDVGVFDHSRPSFGFGGNGVFSAGAGLCFVEVLILPAVLNSKERWDDALF